MTNEPSPLIRALAELARRLGSGVDRTASAFNRSVLLIVLAVAVAISGQALLTDNLGSDGAILVYPALAVLAAASFAAHERLPKFRSCAFAVPTAALGASFVILDFRTRLGWTIIAGTVLAATPLVGLEILRARADRP